MPRKAHSEFWKMRRKFYISNNDAAELFGVTPRTIRNWDRRGAPAWAMRELMIRDRCLGGIHPAWLGFRIGWNGWLYGPHGLKLRPEALRHAGLFFGPWKRSAEVQG